MACQNSSMLSGCRFRLTGVPWPAPSAAALESSAQESLAASCCGRRPRSGLWQRHRASCCPRSRPPSTALASPGMTSTCQPRACCSDTTHQTLLPAHTCAPTLPWRKRVLWTGVRLGCRRPHHLPTQVRTALNLSYQLCGVLLRQPHADIKLATDLGTCELAGIQMLSMCLLMASAWETAVVSGNRKAYARQTQSQFIIVGLLFACCWSTFL